jgi:methionyl-tRNA formyltransferase
MLMTDLRIIFMGTPEFAVASLEALVENAFNVVAVITAPDKPQGRGLKMTHSPVKVSALKHGIEVLQPTNLKSPEFIETLRSYRANLQVVVAFRMLPEVVWSMPELGTFNLHASLLPQYRGAAPINWAIIHGETETGVTTFFLKHEIDTGSILFQDREKIAETDDAGTLYARLMVKGADLVVKTAKAIQQGNVQPMPQPAAENLRHAPKLFKETCEINWSQPGKNVVNFVRGLSPYPAAWTMLNGKVFKIFSVVTVQESGQATVGTINSDNKNYLYVRCTDGWIAVKELQPEGKRKMSIEEFFRGNRI